MSTHILNQHTAGSSIDKDVFGFWLYILSDCILFSVLFASFSVLHENVYGGVKIAELVNVRYVFLETMALLMSSFTCGLSVIEVYRNNRPKVIQWLLVTFLLGGIFIYMEVNEFISLYLEGHSWHGSAALSSFFTLVGTHGLHVTVGLFWMAILVIQFFVYGICPATYKRLSYLALFWAFLDIIWIFVFTIVYLMEVV